MIDQEETTMNQKHEIQIYDIDFDKEINDIVKEIDESDESRMITKEDWTKKCISKMTKKEFSNIVIHQQKIIPEMAKIVIENQDAFAQNMEEIGEVEGADFPIEIKPGSRPFSTQKYNLSKQAEDEIFKQTKVLLEKGLVELSASKWQAACIAVPKKDGTWRICQDWRPLNARTVPIQHTFPRIHQVLSKLGQYRYYITLDIFSGYYHIKIKESDRNYFAYIVDGIGQIRPTRMFFGAMNAPAWFQKTMEKILLSVLFEGWINIYIDDITIGANTIQEAQQRLEKVITLLKEAGMKVKLSKCQFMKPEVEILGWIISNKGKRIIPKRIRAINDWPELTKIPSFLGIVNYLISTIPHCAEYTEKIRKAKKNNDPKDNTLVTDQQTIQQAKQAWKQLVKEVTSERIMAIPEWDKPMEIYTDASDIAIGATLQQEQKIIEFFSQKLKTNQLKWWTIHKEAKAIEQAMEKFYYYLKPYQQGGAMIKLHCDNEALVQILNKQKQPENKQIAACLAQIITMNIDVIYIKGKNNVIADHLSRSIKTLGKRPSSTKGKFKNKKLKMF